MAAEEGIPELYGQLKELFEGVLTITLMAIILNPKAIEEEGKARDWGEVGDLSREKAVEITLGFYSDFFEALKKITNEIKKDIDGEEKVFH